MSRDIVDLSKILMDCGVAFVTFPWGHVHILSKTYFKYLIHFQGDEVPGVSSSDQCGEEKPVLKSTSEHDTM
jgi:hypothetical protein